MEELTVSARKESLYTVLSFVKDFVQARGFESKWFQIELAVEEVFSNIISYAYGENEGNAKVTCEDLDETLRLCFIDDGIPYNPLEQPKPDISVPASQRPIGGLGVYFVKECMDRVLYEYENRQNRLTLEIGRETEDT